MMSIDSKEKRLILDGLDLDTSWNVDNLVFSKEKGAHRYIHFLCRHP